MTLINPITTSLPPYSDDTTDPRDPAFDRLAELAARLVHTSYGLIAVTGNGGLVVTGSACLEPRNERLCLSLCARVLASEQTTPMLVVDDDALGDLRGAGDDVVNGRLVRFFAGRRLVDVSGRAFAVLAVADNEAHTLDDRDFGVLDSVAAVIEDLLRRQPAAGMQGLLRTATKRKALLRDVMHDGMIIQDRNGRILEWNAAAAPLLGVTALELAGRTSLPPEWLALREDGTIWPSEHRPALQAIRTGKTVKDVILGIHRPDTSIGWLRVTSVPLTDDDGAVNGALTTFADVTAELEDRRRAARADTKASQPRPGRYDRVLLSATLIDYAHALDALSGVLKRDRDYVDDLLTDIDQGGNLLDFITATPAAADGHSVTGTISQLETRRRRLRFELFKALQAHGANVADIAKIWKISRQLASRILTEGATHDNAPHPHTPRETTDDPIRNQSREHP